MSPRRLVLLAVLVILCCSVASAAYSQSGGSTTPREERLALPVFVADHETRPEQPTQSAATIPWSRVVFQSFRDGNWEIYMSRDDGSELRRLTNDLASDISPRLDRGAARLAFSSNRDGDYDIYVAYLDSSKLRKLTQSREPDRLPAWSPDGEMLAYESVVDGQAELFLVNADGSGQAQLTYYPGYDGTPTWSPDGKKIAFCRSVGDSLYVHEMDVVTKSVTMLVSQRDSCDPSYSPDRTQLLYDADPDGDGWYRPWVMNLDGSNKKEVPNYGNSPYKDVFASGWSPDSRRVNLTQVLYVERDGRLYIDSISAISVKPSDGGDNINLGQGELEASPDWQTTDNQPPISSLMQLPPYSRARGFALRWTGQEVGESGFAGFNVQRQKASSPQWETIRSGIVDTFTIAGGPAGETIGYRVEAFDFAYNHESVSDIPETKTTLYAARVSTLATDNRGTLIHGFSPIYAPVPVYQTAPDSQGRSSALVANTATTLSLIRPRYGQSPALSREFWVDSELTSYLPPAESRVSNGHFEEPVNHLSGWTQEGSLPIAVFTQRPYSGKNAVSVGTGCTSEQCLNLRGPVTTAYPEGGQDIAVDWEGNVHLVFQGYHPDNFNRRGIYYTVRNQEGVWSELVALMEKSGGFGGNGAKTFIEVDPTGTLYAAFAEPRSDEQLTTYFATKAPGQPWSPPELVLADGLPSALLVGQSGQVWITSGGDMYLRNGPQKWSLFASQGAGSWDIYGTVAAAIDQSGLVHTVWQALFSEIYGDHTFIYQAFLPDGTPYPIELPLSGHDLSGAEVLDLFVDGKGTVHLLAYLFDMASSSRGIVYTKKEVGGSWSAISKLPEWAQRYAEFVVDDTGFVHVLFQDNHSSRYVRLGPDGTWTNSVELVQNGDSIEQSLEIGPDNSLHGAGLAYLDSGPALAYYGNAPASASGTSTLSQSVAIPANMPNPTLAFMKQVLNDEPGDGTGAFVRLAVEGLTQDFPISGDAEWSLGWVDATPWKGKTVTVTFGVNQTADAPDLQLLLDAVSLGPAYADTMTTIAGPLAALPGEEVAYVLTAGNRGGVGSGPVTLNLTLPAGLTLVEALPEPIIDGQNLRWDIAALPAGATETIQLRLKVAGAGLGMKVMLNSVLQTDPVEPEAANNATSASLFIGNQALAPIVIRP